jgi:protein ImuA
MLVVVDRRREFYPPAAASLGLAMEQMVIVRPASAADEAWAMDQALRSAGVGAALVWLDKLGDHTFRRWQLAAEASGAIGLLVRPAAARGSPSWADVKVLITPLDKSRSPHERWRFDILRCRGAPWQSSECGVRSAELSAAISFPLCIPNSALPTAP